MRYMKKTMKKEAETVVCKDKVKGEMTLRQVFESLGLSAHDLSVNMLDVHADRNTFHRSISILLVTFPQRVNACVLDY